MFEAYKVGVTLALTNHISRGLGFVMRDLARTDAQAIKLKKTLHSMEKLALGGAVTAGVGYALLKPVHASLDAAKEYAHQLNILKMAGMSQVEIAESVGAAWKNAQDIMTTNPTGNLASILDLRNVTGSLKEAKEILPIVSKIQTVMAASAEPGIRANAEGVAYSMAKALDIIGAVGNPEELVKQANMMTKVVTSTGNRVTPEMYQSVFQYARQGKFDLSNEFKYEILPTLMQEAATRKGGGGGSKGVGPALAAMYRITNQGYINRKSQAEWEALGLVAPGTALKTTTSGTTVGPMKDAAGASANSFKWVNEVLVPAIRAKYGEAASPQFIRQEINALYRGNQLAASLAVEFFTKHQNFLREQQNIRKAMGYEGGFDAAIANDPETLEQAAAAQFKALKIQIGTELIPLILPALHGLAVGLREIGTWARENPTLFKTLVYGFTALGVAMTIAGTVLLLKAAFLGLGTVIGVANGAGTLGAAGKFALALGKTGLAGALLVAAAATIIYHKEIADWIDSHDWGKKVGDGLMWLDRAGALTTGGNLLPQNNTPPPGKNPPLEGTMRVQNGDLMVDYVSKKQARRMSGPAQSAGMFDGRQSYVPVGATGAW